MFSDVRTYWSPDAVERVTGRRLSGPGEHGFLHLINSGPSALDWTGEQSIDGEPVCKPFWDISSAEAQSCLDETKWCASDLGYFPAGGWSTDFATRGGMPCTMFRINLVKGLGPVLQIAEGSTIALAPGHPRRPRSANEPKLCQPHGSCLFHDGTPSSATCTT